jgi:hypothetical protein
MRNQGGLANTQPFRKLPRPVLLEKGIPIGMVLVAQDAYHQAQMQRYLSISEGIGGNLAIVSASANLLPTTPLPTGGVAYMPELTLDQGANAFSGQQVTTTRVKMKGGTIKLSILIKGVEVWGPWKEYITKNLSQYISSPGTSGSAGMSGLPALR